LRSASRDADLQPFFVMRTGGGCRVARDSVFPWSLPLPRVFRFSRDLLLEYEFASCVHRGADGSLGRFADCLGNLSPEKSFSVPRPHTVRAAGRTDCSLAAQAAFGASKGDGKCSDVVRFAVSYLFGSSLCPKALRDARSLRSGLPCNVCASMGRRDFRHFDGMGCRFCLCGPF
jgi:hypothetical protein